MPDTILKKGSIEENAVLPEEPKVVLNSKGKPKMSLEERKARYPNLIGFDEMPKEEHLAYVRKGNAAQKAAMRNRRPFRLLLNEVLKHEIQDEDVANILMGYGIEPTFQMQMAFKAVLKACQGDIEAARFVRDTVGEKPAENMTIGVTDPARLDAYDMSHLTEAELLELAEAAEHARDE